MGSKEENRQEPLALVSSEDIRLRYQGCEKEKRVWLESERRMNGKGGTGTAVPEVNLFLEPRHAHASSEILWLPRLPPLDLFLLYGLLGTLLRQKGQLRRG